MKNNYNTLEVIIIMFIMTSFGVVATLFFTTNIKKDLNLIDLSKDIIENSYAYDTYGKLDELIVKGLTKELDHVSIEECSLSQLDTLKTGYIHGFGFETIYNNGNYLVTKIYKDSPSYKGNLKEGDIIKSINNKLISISSSEDLDKELKKDEIDIVLTNEKKYTLKKDLIPFNSIKILSDDEIQINYLTKRTYLELKDAIKDIKINNLTLDISYLNTGDINSLQDVLSLFLKKDTTIGSIIQKDNIVFIKTLKEPVYTGSLNIKTSKETEGIGELLGNALLSTYKTPIKTKGYVFSKKQLKDTKCIVLPEYIWDISMLDE